MKPAKESDGEECLGPVFRALSISQGLGGDSSLMPWRDPLCGGHLESDPGHRVREALALRRHSRYEGNMTYVPILKKGWDF